MITSFGDQGTQDVFTGDNTKAARKVAPQAIWPVARRKIAMVNAAAKLADLKIPPNNQLEALKEELKGRHSIRINDQYRVVFVFKEGQASEVRIMDYH